MRINEKSASYQVSYGRDEYVLLPMPIYRSLHHEIDKKLLALQSRKKVKEDCVLFFLEDYVDNPVAIARIKAGITQEELAEKFGVSQAYISKLEGQEKVSPKTLQKILSALDGHVYSPHMNFRFSNLFFSAI